MLDLKQTETASSHPPKYTKTYSKYTNKALFHTGPPSTSKRHERGKTLIHFISSWPIFMLWGPWSYKNKLLGQLCRIKRFASWQLPLGYYSYLCPNTAQLAKLHLQHVPPLSPLTHFSMFCFSEVQFFRSGLWPSQFLITLKYGNAYANSNGKLNWQIGDFYSLQKLWLLLCPQNTAHHTQTAAHHTQTASPFWCGFFGLLLPSPIGGKKNKS